MSTHCVSCALTVPDELVHSTPGSSTYSLPLSLFLSSFVGVSSGPRAAVPRVPEEASERVLALAVHFDDIISDAGRNAGDIATTSLHDIDTIGRERSRIVAT